MAAETFGREAVWKEGEKRGGEEMFLFAGKDCRVRGGVQDHTHTMYMST
jgi:hypothetical protein